MKSISMIMAAKTAQACARYKQNIENFISIANLTDAQAAAKIRMDEIDILIDLHGLSLGIRAEILAYRPAPIQMTYLGYIGTTMMPYVDYVITDEYSFTEPMAQYFSETPLKLKHCCLPTDRKNMLIPRLRAKKRVCLTINSYLRHSIMRIN